MKCTMKEPNIHPACVARGREFEPEGWQITKRATTCKDCNQIRNAAYRALRAGKAPEAIEAERARARGGQLAVAGDPGRSSKATGGASGSKATTVGDGRFYLLHGSDIVITGKDKDGSVRYTATPAESVIIDFRQPGVETDRAGATIIQCPRCGDRGEHYKPKGEWMDAIVTHRRALVGPDRMPRMLEYCAISRNTAVSDALRDADRGRRAAARLEEEAAG